MAFSLIVINLCARTSIYSYTRVVFSLHFSSEQWMLYDDVPSFIQHHTMYFVMYSIDSQSVPHVMILILTHIPSTSPSPSPV